MLGHRDTLCRLAQGAALAGALLSLSQPALSQGSKVQQLGSGIKRAVDPMLGNTDKRLEQVATFDHQVTGVTVAEDGRIFVNFPRWSEDVPVSVAELMKDGTIRPYPDNEWNAWRNADNGKLSAKDHFVAVQSVVADQRGSLWVVDPAAPNSEKTIKDGPKLVQIDLKSNTVARTFPMPPEVAGPASYLNDIRIAPDGKYAYLTDSGMPGGLVVVDITSGESWRALSGDERTQADMSVIVMTDGKPLRRPDGRQPMFNADGVALSPDGQFLYWQALTGKSLYRVPTEALRQAKREPGKISEKVEKIAETEPVDGLWMLSDGRLLLSSIASNAIKFLEPSGAPEILLADSRLRWPDTFAQGPDGFVYVTASHIQDSPWFHPSWTDKHFALFRFKP